MEECGRCGAEASQSIEIRTSRTQAELSLCTFHFKELINLARPQVCSPLPNRTRRALSKLVEGPATAE